MKLSQFNIIAKEDKYIIYNTFSTACVVLDDVLFREIFVDKNFPVKKNRKVC